MNAFLFFKNKKNDLQSSFNYWLNEILMNEQPSEDIIAYNFGIYEVKNGSQIYLAGFKEYNPEDEDWATGLGDFQPKNQIFKKLIKDKNWELIQKKVVELINNFLQTSAYENSFLSKAIAITTGFDDGNLIKLK